MWTTKYKPTEFHHFVGNHEIMNRFQQLSTQGIYQHLIVCGHHGTGKTAAVQLLISKLLGNKINQGLLKLSMIDNHDIQTIREKIHQFVPKKVLFDNGSKMKIILFDNADYLLSDGTQQVMERLMEQHLQHTIFIFICKNANHLIESIHSRCQTIRFSPVSIEDQMQYYQQLCQWESLPFETEALHWITKLTNGDIRMGINYLQALSTKGEITVQNVHCENIFPFANELRGCIVHLLNDRLLSALEIPTLLHQKGLSCLDIIMFIGNAIEKDPISPTIKVIVMTNVAITFKKMVEGVDSLLQVYDMMVHICEEIKQKRSIMKVDDVILP